MTVPSPFKVHIMELMHDNKTGWETRKFTLLVFYIDLVLINNVLYVLELSGRKQ